MNNKTLIMIIFAILIVTLACSGSAISTPQAIETPQTTPKQGITSKAFATSEQICAMVTASHSLHLRSDPNFESAIVGYLYHDQIIQVIAPDNLNANWWHVQAKDTDGYARADYLKTITCTNQSITPTPRANSLLH